MRNSLLCVTLLSLALVVSCSDGPASGLVNEQFETERDASAEDMQAARTLSLVEGGNIAGGDPYEKAQRCSVAIGALAEGVEGLGTFSPEQIQVLVDAKAVYERRMRSEASGREQPSQGTLEETPQQDPERSQIAEQARGAIECLRELGIS